MGMPAGMCGRENRAPAKHVDIGVARFSDAGSIPAASTKPLRPPQIARVFLATGSERS